MLIGGLMGFGVFDAPRIRNLDVRAGEVGTVTASFAWDGQTAGWRWWGYVDGDAASECGPGAPFVSDPLGDGTHNVSVLAWEEWVTPIPQAWGSVDGRQVYLNWSAVSDADVRRYQILWDEGVGGDADALLDTVQRVELQGVTGGERPRFVLPTAGTGTGRVTLGGTYTGDPINTVWKVKVLAGQKYALDTGGGYGGGRDWRSGVTLNLGSGLTVRFDSATSLYDVDDEWEFRVGPRSWWASGELVNGTYKFAVAAVDAAGNVGTASSERTVVVAGGPEPVANLEASYNATSEAVTITWDDPPSLDDVVIYSNWNAVFEVIEPFVLDDGPLAVVGDGVEEWVLNLPSGTEGELLFYVRAREGGVEDGTSQLLRVTAEAQAPPELLSPTVSSAEAGPDGALIVTAAVDLRGGVPEELALFVANTATPDWGTATAEEVVAFAGAGYPIALQVITATGPFAGSQWVTVRARDDDGGETRNEDVTEVVADDTPPGSPTLTTAVPT